MRFDARYFAVRAETDLQPIPDGTETAAAWWAAPRQLLEDWGQDRRLLFWPTYVTMEALATCGSVEDLFALAIDTREPDDGDLGRLPVSTFWQGPR